MNVFITTLKPILMLCKIVGIIKTSYYFESNGLLVKNTNSRYHSVFEFSKTVVLLLLTYYCHRKFEFIDKLILYRFWAVIITSRISETWIIKYDIIYILIIIMSMIPPTYTYDYIQQGFLEMTTELTLALLAINIFQKHL